jgi:acyl carrier protein
VAVVQGQAGYVAPRTAIEEMLAGLFAEALRVDRVGIEDDFFALGGNSVGAILLLSRIREAFATDLPFQEVLQTPTVAGIAEALVRHQASHLEDAEMAALLAELDSLSDEEALQALSELSYE